MTMIPEINSYSVVGDPDEPSKDSRRLASLGTVRQRHADTQEIIKIPTPSEHPDDPLNWPQCFKWLMAILICFAVFMANFLAAGPSIAMLQTAEDFFPVDHDLSGAISKTAYFFSTTSLSQGLGNLFWMPLCNKYGRRPVYIASLTLYLACVIWLSLTTSYGSFLAGRIVMGLGSGASETLAPVSIADVFFLHERGTVMAMYTSSMSSGVAFGILIAGAITSLHHWRYIYYVSIPLIAIVLLLAIFTFPETAYRRDPSDLQIELRPLRPPTREAPKTKHDVQNLEVVNLPAPTREAPKTKHDVQNLEVVNLPAPRAKKFVPRLAIYTGTYTSEKLLSMFLRPFALILLPPVLWGSLVMSATIGFVVAITSNVATAYTSTYAMQTWQIGLCFISAILGSLIGIFFGGNLSDRVADCMARKNAGIREPEMRLSALCLALVTAPAALLMYGAGIQYKLHWMCPTIGLGLLNFSIAYATNISLVYTIDAYRPIAGEVTVTTIAFKSAFGFLLSFYTNTWIAEAGYLGAYGEMAAIAFVVMILGIPLYFWGKQIRCASWDWRIVRYAHWGEDREVGE